MISGLMSADYARIGKSLEDVIIEPVRSMLIPFYDQVKSVALESGALGCNISGSGPSTFSLTNDQNKAATIMKNCADIYETAGISTISFISPINAEGCKLL